MYFLLTDLIRAEVNFEAALVRVYRISYPVRFSTLAVILLRMNCVEIVLTL